MPDEEHRNTIRAPLYSGGKRTKIIEIPRQPHGWTEEHCPCPDYLATIDISHTAPWHHRHRYESTITLVCNDDDDREAGPIRARRDFEPTTKLLTSLRQQHGGQHYSIPKNERMRQRTFDKEFRPELEWMSQDRKTIWSQPSSSSSSSQQWWHHERQVSPMARKPRHSTASSSMARSPLARSLAVERVMATDSMQILRGSHFARFLRTRRFYS